MKLFSCQRLTLLNRIALDFQDMIDVRKSSAQNDCVKVSLRK